jgi:rubrerythrin
MGAVANHAGAPQIVSNWPIAHGDNPWNTNMKKRSTSRTHSNSRPATRKGAASQVRSRTRAPHLSQEWLKDFFSEMLAVEHGGIELYEKALEELTHDDLRSKLEQFHEQTQQHVELCEEMLNAAGGNPDEMSPGAEAAEHKAQGLLSAEVPDEMKDINNIENLVLAETKDHWNWETLSEAAKLIKDRDLKSVVTAAVREAAKQEQDHITWNSETLTELAQEMAEESAHEALEEEEDKEDWKADQK